LKSPCIKSLSSVIDWQIMSPTFCRHVQCTECKKKETKFEDKNGLEKCMENRDAILVPLREKLEVYCMITRTHICYLFFFTYMLFCIILKAEIPIYIKFNFIWLNSKCINIYWKIHIFMHSHKLSLNYRFLTY